MTNLKEKFERVKIKDILSIFLFVIAIPEAFFLRKKRPDMWLICEYANEAQDNAFWLYRYICQHHKGQDVVYAINKHSKSYEKVKNLGEVIQYGGYKHWVYYLAASKNISSQKGGKPNAAVCYVLEVSGLLKNVRIFLQHGITINNVTWLAYENTKMNLFVCGAKKEYEFVKDTFGYPEGFVQYLGFARFDGLHDCVIKKKQILVMPTWREWIVDKTSKAFELDDMTSFESTEYFKYWNAFLNSKKIAQILEENQLELIFYPHREMQRYIHSFTTASSRIVMANCEKYDVQTLLKESAFMITDYSSVCMDFGYMRKPMILYQFDQEKFRKGQYDEGYFDYAQDGFGPVCRSLQEVEEEFEKAVNRNLEVEDLYLQREKDFFTLWDTNNCQRIYEAIKKLK